MECWFKLKFNFLPISLMAEILLHSVSKFFSFFAVEEYNTWQELLKYSLFTSASYKEFCFLFV